MNQIKLLFLLIFISSFFSSCISYKTTFSPHQADKTYTSKTPCEARMLRKIDERELQQYDLIGKCKSNKLSGTTAKQVNYAVKDIQICACKNGGDLILITDSAEHHTTIYSMYGIYTSRTSDEIEALIFRKK